MIHESGYRNTGRLEEAPENSALVANVVADTCVCQNRFDHCGSGSGNVKRGGGEDEPIF